jgi:hypothetical protein
LIDRARDALQGVQLPLELTNDLLALALVDGDRSVEEDGLVVVLASDRAQS